jgi:hypothetical protein
MYHHNAIRMSTVADPFYISKMDYEVQNILTTSDKRGIYRNNKPTTPIITSM